MGGSICKTTSIKCTMARVPVEVVYVLPKIEPGHLPISLPHTYMWWHSTVHRHRSKVFHCCGHGKWVLESSGRRGGMIKTGILCPVRKAVVEGYAYGGYKCGSNISSNDDEATDRMVQTIQGTWFEKCLIKNYCWQCVTVWTHIQLASRLFQNSPGCPWTQPCYTKT